MGKKRKLFALQGRSNVGKTTTLKLLLDEILAKCKVKQVESVRPKTDIEISVVITLADGTLIGIESVGDPHSALQDGLKLLAARGCDIIFCACRTKGMTVAWVNAMKPEYEIEFVPKDEVEAGQREANREAAVKLMGAAGLP